MKVLSFTVHHYPNVSKRKKPLTPIRHTTEDHASMEVLVTEEGQADKIFIVHGLSSAPVAYKTRIALLYVTVRLNSKKAKPLPGNILYQDIVDWFNTQTFS